jgi:hypothetical protein
MAVDCVMLKTAEAQGSDGQGNLSDADETGLFWEKSARGKPVHGTSGAPVSIKHAADITTDVWNPNWPMHVTPHFP